MTFDEASARFAQLEAMWRAGQMAQPQFAAAVGELRVQDASGAWWQIDPQTRAWLMWNGVGWVNPAHPQTPVTAPPVYPQPYAQAQPQAYPQPYARGPQPGAQYAAQAQPQAVSGASAMKGAWDGMISMTPGLVVDAIQRWGVYKQNPSMMVSVVAPALISGVLVPLVPKIGKVLPTIVVLGCLGWLCWPVIDQWAEISKESKGVQNQMGRGLVGMSLVYLIPRIWRTRS